MTNIIIDRNVELELKRLCAEQELCCSLLVGIVAGDTTLITGLVPVSCETGDWPQSSIIVGTARKLRRRLIGNAFVVGLIFSSPDEKKLNTSNISAFQSTIGSIRSSFEATSTLISDFFNRKSLYERCNLLLIHNQAKDNLQCRRLPEFRNVEHSFVDLGSRGQWMKGICRICINTSSVSLVSLEENEASRGIHRILEDVLISIFGDLNSKTSRFHAVGKGITVTDSGEVSLAALFPSEPYTAEFELQCQPFVRKKEVLYSEEAEYFRVSVAGDIETAVCLHSKYSNISDLYNGLLCDIVFTLADVLSSTLRTFKKGVDEGDEEYALLTLPKRTLPDVCLPGKDAQDLLNWCLVTYDSGCSDSTELEYIFHRDKVMNEISSEPKLSSKPIARGIKGASHDDGISLDNLSCSTSYGAAMFFFGGLALAILAISIQSFLPDFSG